MLKCGMSQGLLGEKASSERANDHELGRGISLVLRANRVLGSGEGEVMIAR